MRSKAESELSKLMLSARKVSWMGVIWSSLNCIMTGFVLLYTGHVGTVRRKAVRSGLDLSSPSRQILTAKCGRRIVIVGECDKVSSVGHADCIGRRLKESCEQARKET